MSADFFHGDEETALVFADVLKVMRYNVAPLLTGYNDGGYGTTYLFEIFVARRVLLTRMMYVHLGETLRKYITLQRRCIAMIDYIYGDDSIVLSDIYQFVCRHKIDFLLYDEALDYATRCLHIVVYLPVTLTLLARLSRPHPTYSRCLAIRVAALGLLHDKTAQAQYFVGVVCIHQGAAAEATAMLSDCREARGSGATTF